MIPPYRSSSYEILETATLRVCLFTTSFLPLVGGAERSADLVARGLTQRGHEVMVLAQRSRILPGPLPYRVRHYLRPPRQHYWPEALAFYLFKAWCLWRFDMVLAFDSYPVGYAANWIKHFGGVPVITSPRGGDVQNGFHALAKPRVLKCLVSGYRRSNRIIAISQWVKDRVIQLSGEQGLPPIDIVHNGIDLLAHDTLRDQARLTSPSFDLQKPYVLHLARVNDNKQQLTAIRAVHLLREEFLARNLQYAIVGDGNGMDELRKLLADLNLHHIVKILGTRTGLEKAALFDNAEFFVTASLCEGFGHVLIESLAAGLPILASDIPTHREVLPPGTGIFFAPGSAEDFARQMRIMLDAAPAMRPTALSARHTYSLTAMIDGYERSCLACLSDSKTPENSPSPAAPHPASHPTQ
jgi:glycosyltransferase involved in cell wall biosynthesis